MAQGNLGSRGEGATTHPNIAATESSKSLEERRKEMSEFGAMLFILGYFITLIVAAFGADVYFTSGENGPGKGFWMTMLGGTYLGLLAWHIQVTWKKKGLGAACASGVVGLGLFAVTAASMSGNMALTIAIGAVLSGPVIMAVGFYIRRKASRLQ